jgi:hypothetical protein
MVLSCCQDETSETSEISTSKKTAYTDGVPEFDDRETTSKLSRAKQSVAKLTAIRTETGERILGAGRGSVRILSDDWDQPMTGDEADAFLGWALVNPTHLLDTATLTLAVHAPGNLSTAARDICASRESANRSHSVVEALCYRVGVPGAAAPAAACRTALPFIHRDPADRLLIAQRGSGANFPGQPGRSHPAVPG